MNDEKLIWDTLMEAIGNPYGVAGLMGNLFAESSLNPMCKTGGNAIARDMKSTQYAELIDTFQYDIDDFSHDECAFGLAQWRYWSRKEAMYQIWQAQKAGISIGDLMFQLDFLLFEIEQYQTVWNTMKNASSVKEASDIIMERYERPGNIADQAKEKRARFGQDYYDKYAKQDEPSPARVRTIKNNVNIRRGNSKKYNVITQIQEKGTCFPYVTKVDGWYAIEVVANHTRQIGWISSEFSEVI